MVRAEPWLMLTREGKSAGERPEIVIRAETCFQLWSVTCLGVLLSVHIQNDHWISWCFFKTQFRIFFHPSWILPLFIWFALLLLHFCSIEAESQQVTNQTPGGSGNQ